MARGSVLLVAAALALCCVSAPVSACSVCSTAGCIPQVGGMQGFGMCVMMETGLCYTGEKTCIAAIETERAIPQPRGRREGVIRITAPAEPALDDVQFIIKTVYLLTVRTFHY